MDVAVADHRLAVARGEAFGRAIEVDAPNEHRVAFHGIEQIRVPLQRAAQGRGRRKERMRRDDEPRRARLQPGEIGERPHVVRAARKVQQQHVASFDGALDARNQHDSALGGVGRESAQIELAVVQRNRQRVVAKRGGVVDQLERRMRNRVDRVVRGVGMKLDFQHLDRLYFRRRMLPKMGNEFGSPLTNAVARQYDLFQQSLEAIEKERKFLNYGYTVDGDEPIEERQQRLCLEVFGAAEIAGDHLVVDVGFGSGEQDFLLARTFEFRRLVGFNISDRQVRYATERASREKLDHKLTFRLGEAETLPGIEDASVDRLVAVECAFYFDRPLFYRTRGAGAEAGRPARARRYSAVRSPGVPDAARRSAPGRHGVGESSGSGSATSARGRCRHINRQTRPGVQMSVWQILKTASFARFTAAERREWLKMAYYSQLVALGLSLELVTYDLLVFEKVSGSYGPGRRDPRAWR